MYNTAKNPICSHEEWLDPDYGLEDSLGTCPRCGEDLYEGDYVYQSVEDDQMICEACFTEESRDHRKEIKVPEPDWDDMPGGADFCDW